MLDLLSDVLSRLNIQGTLYFRTAFTPPFGLEVPRYHNVARFHFVHKGRCVVRAIESDETVTLEEGDIAIVPHGASHHLLSGTESTSRVLPLDRVVETAGFTGQGVLVHGGDGADAPAELICGHIAFNSDRRHVIFDRMPPLLHIRNYGETAGLWMQATLKMIAHEKRSDRPGGDLIALKMTEAVFAHCIRTFLEQQAKTVPGLAGFGNPHLRRALDAFHRTPARQWTVENLAQEAGMSRTAFAQGFAEQLDQTPLQYMTAWRMQIARQMLRESKMNIGDVAMHVGYASEAAFARAFKKATGLTPAAYRKLGSE